MIFGKLTKLLSRQRGSNVYGPMRTKVLRVDLLNWQKSRALWLGLFLIGNLLDMFSTYVGFNKGGMFIELNPLVNLFGWNLAIAIRLIWIAACAWMAYKFWETDAKSAKAFLLILSTVLILVSLFNIVPIIDTERANEIFCWQALNWNYMQNLLQEQLSILDFERVMEACISGSAH